MFEISVYFKRWSYSNKSLLTSEREKRWQILSIQSNRVISITFLHITAVGSAIQFVWGFYITTPPPPSSHQAFNICNPLYKPAEMSIFIKKILNNFMRRSWARFHVRSHCFCFFFLLFSVQLNLLQWLWLAHTHTQTFECVYPLE